VTWWFVPIDRVNTNLFAPGVFDERNIVAIGYSAFGFILGVTAGLLIRRTVPAMAATLVAFVAVRVAMIFLVRPYLMPPANIDAALKSSASLGFEPGALGITFVADAPNIPNALVMSSHIVDSAGHVPTAQALHDFLYGACPTIVAPTVSPTGNAARGPADQGPFNDCVAQLSTQFHLAVTYQPADRYWTFQWVETAIFLGLAVLLVGFCFWWVRNRLS
jgi:hypothetical protein